MTDHKTEASNLLPAPPSITTISRVWLPTYILMCFAFLVDRGNEFASQGLGRAFEEDFGATPDDLASLTLAGALSLAVCCPLWGYLADRYPRPQLMAIGCAVWSVFTAIAACAQSFWVLVFCAGGAGIFLGAVRPIALSIVAEIVPPSRMGGANGLLLSFSACGSLIGVGGATIIGEKQVLGMQGWRVVLAILVVLSLSLMTATLCMAAEPRGKQGGSAATPGEFFSTMRQVLKIRSFGLISVCGMLCQIPFCLGTFWILWLRYNGYSTGTSTVVFGSALISLIGGTYFGGKAGDWMAVRHPDHGRVWVAQCSVACSALICVVALLLIPTGANSAPWYAICLASMGLFGQVTCGLANPHNHWMSPPPPHPTMHPSVPLTRPPLSTHLLTHQPPTLLPARLPTHPSARPAQRPTDQPTDHRLIACPPAACPPAVAFASLSTLF